MGWFWGFTDASSTSGSSGDAYNKLDPSLRDFLDQESPAAQSQPKPSPSDRASSRNAQPQESYRSQMGVTKTASSTSPSKAEPTAASTTSASSPAAVPRESLYQDGRYAHLWKNYQPLSTVESTQRTEQDQLTDVIDAYNERKASIGRAAVENCVFEQIAEHDCFKKGGWHAKMTMCREENKAFNRCYQMQSRFLKALGYLGMQRSPEEEERIQMHADKLYQEMLAREQAIEKAKEEGKEEPQFKPLLNNASVADAMGIRAIPSSSASSAQQTPPGAIAAAANKTQAFTTTDLPKKEGLDIYAQEKRDEIEKRLAGKSKAERDLEIQLLVAESQASVEYAEKIRDYYEGEKTARADRKERGRETFGDSIKRMWGWDR